MLWHLMLPALVHFVLVFTRLSERKGFGLAYIPLYGTALTFALLDYFGNQVVDGPRASPWGWSYGVIQQTLVGDLNVFWCAVLIFVGILLCLRHYVKTTDKRERLPMKRSLTCSDITGTS